MLLAEPEPCHHGLVARHIGGVGRLDDLPHHIDATDEREAPHDLAPTRRRQRVLVVDAGV
jgi:hypothetical protein